MQIVGLGPHRVPAKTGFLTNEDEASFRDGKYSGQAVMTILLNDQGDILLNLRDNFPHILYPDHWAIIGGAVEPEESLEVAVGREIAEEIGYEISESVEYCKVIDRMGVGHLVSVFIAPINSKAEDLNLTEGAALRYFNRSELDALRMTPFLKEVVLHFYKAWDQVRMSEP